VEFEVAIDKQGRLVIPSRVRKLLGIDKGGRVVLRYRGDKIEIIVVNRNLERKVRKWVEETLKLKLKPFSEKPVAEGKWLDEEYARRKLGAY